MILTTSNGWGLAAGLAAAASYAVLALVIPKPSAPARLAVPDLGLPDERMPAVSSPSALLPSSFLALAWLLHGFAIAEALLIPPVRFGFAPALSVTVWLVLTVYAVESRLIPALRAHWILPGLGSAAVLLSLLFPGTTYPTIASPWLPLHWALGLASYGLLAAAVVHGWLMTRAEKAIRLATADSAGVPLMTLERLTFRLVEGGFVLLSATLLAGGLFAEQLYGAHLASMLNHKTILSVMAWVTLAALLIGRARLGWRGTKAVRLLYMGCGLLLLAYVGSHFVLEVILERA